MVITQSISFHHCRLEPGCGLSRFILREWHFRSELLRRSQRAQPGDILVSVHVAGPRTTVPERKHSTSPPTVADDSEKLRNDKQMFLNNSIHVLQIKQVLSSSRRETERWNSQVSLSQNSSNTQSHKSRRLLWPAHSPRYERITIELLKLHSRRSGDFRSTFILHSPNLQQLLLRRSWRLIMAEFVVDSDGGFFTNPDPQLDLF